MTSIPKREDLKHEQVALHRTHDTRSMHRKTVEGHTCVSVRVRVRVLVCGKGGRRLLANSICNCPTTGEQIPSHTIILLPDLKTLCSIAANEDSNFVAYPLPPSLGRVDLYLLLPLKSVNSADPMV